MDTIEKIELKKEITDEVKESLTRTAGKLITRRILLALAIIVFELLFWTLIITSVVKDELVSDAVWVCFLGCYLRVAQAWFISMFRKN